MEPAAATRTEVTVKLSLTPEEERMLVARATEKGQDVARLSAHPSRGGPEAATGLESRSWPPIPRGLPPQRHDRRRTFCAHR